MLILHILDLSVVHFKKIETVLKDHMPINETTFLRSLKGSHNTDFTVLNNCQRHGLQISHKANFTIILYNFFESIEVGLLRLTSAYCKHIWQ